MITKKESTSKIIIDLDGQQGNAYVLLGYAIQYCKDLKLNKEEIKAEMMLGDYHHLVRTFDKYFGEYVELQTSNESLLKRLKDKDYGKTIIE